MNPVKESEITMASVEKFSAGAVRNQLRHNRREIEHSGNPDIDPSRQGQDYVLSPDRGMSDYDYFLQRKSELYCYNLSLIHISEPTRRTPISYAVFCLKKKKTNTKKKEKEKKKKR